MDPELLFHNFMATIGSMEANTRVVFVVLNIEDFELLRSWRDFAQSFNDEEPELLETPMGGQPQGLFRGIWICTTRWIDRGRMIPYPELEQQAVNMGSPYTDAWIHQNDAGGFYAPFTRRPLQGFTLLRPEVETVTMTLKVDEPPIERPTVWEHLDEE